MSGDGIVVHFFDRFLGVDIDQRKTFLHLVSQAKLPSASS